MPELDNMEPEMDQEPQNDVIGTHGETDREGAMAKADLFKLANYAHKLYQQMNDEDQLEAWVQAKITKAADYIASVYHYLEYEMKFSEYGHHLDNSDTLSEGQKRVLKARLMEAKDKMKELKKTQAEKVKEKKVDEGVMTGGEQECAECGGTGVVHVPGVQPSDRAKELARKHNTSTRAHYAAMKRLQAEENIDEESEGNAFTAHKRAKADNDGDFEDKPSSTGGKISRKGGVTRHKGNTDRFSDEPYDSSNDRTKSHAKARSSADKAGEREMDKAAEKESKAWGKANPGKQTIHKDGKTTTNEAKKAAKDYDGDGKIESGKDEYLGSRIAAAKKAGKLKECGAGCECDKCQSAKKVVKEDVNRIATLTSLIAAYEAEYKTATGSNKTNLARTIMMFRQQLEAETEAARRAQDAQQRQVQEAKPSAGLSAAKKSAVVKDAKAGKDIGKPGKSFDKVAKSAGGGEKGEKIAAAAMWKNMKETVAYIAEKAKATKPDYIDLDKDGDKTEPMKKAAKEKETVKESTDLARMRQLMTRLNG